MEKFGINRYIINDILINTRSKYVIYVKKREFRLFVINRYKEVEKIFTISVGLKKDFERKAYEGDDGTPEGLYYVVEILSSDAEKGSYAYNKLRDMNAVYFKAEDGHFLWGKPDQDAGTDVYGPRFFRLDYPNKNDEAYYNKLKKQGKIPGNKDGTIKDMGTGIGIHGTNDPVAIGHRISSGCIRMNNDDVKLLDQYLQVGSPVYIEK